MFTVLCTHRVRERERERVCVCVCACVCARARACTGTAFSTPLIIYVSWFYCFYGMILYSHEKYLALLGAESCNCIQESASENCTELYHCTHCTRACVCVCVRACIACVRACMSTAIINFSATLKDLSDASNVSLPKSNVYPSENSNNNNFNCFNKLCM
jgi:hypothetical protein